MQARIRKNMLMDKVAPIDTFSTLLTVYESNIDTRKIGTKIQSIIKGACPLQQMEEKLCTRPTKNKKNKKPIELSIQVLY